MGQEETQRDNKEAPPLSQARDVERRQGTDSVEEVELMPWQRWGVGEGGKGNQPPRPFELERMKKAFFHLANV